MLIQDAEILTQNIMKRGLGAVPANPFPLKSSQADNRGFDSQHLLQ